MHDKCSVDARSRDGGDFEEPVTAGETATIKGDQDIMNYYTVTATDGREFRVIAYSPSHARRRVITDTCGRVEIASVRRFA